MKRHIFGLWVALCAALFAGPAAAGPLADFEAEMRAAYAQYRAALFNTGRRDGADEAGKALADFIARWQTLSARYAAAPPPHFAEDPEWSDTLAAITDIARRARDEIAQNALPQAHVTLEEIRALVGELRRRNNVFTFSDRMNAFHEEMEELLSVDPRQVRAKEQQGQVAVLTYLAENLEKNAPEPLQQDKDFERQLEGLFAAIQQTRAAIDGGKPDTIERAFKTLKAAYGRLFVKFG